MRNETSNRQNFEIVGSFNEDPVKKIDAQRTINLYEVFEETAKKQKFLVPTPGLKLETTPVFANGGIFRGALAHYDKTAAATFVYFIVGDSFYRMDSSLTVTLYGAFNLTTAVGYVGMAANENQIMVVDGTSTALIFDEPGTVLSLVVFSGPSPPAADPIDITFMDGYFIIIDSKTNQFFVSNLNDGKMWGTNNFALINSSPTIGRGIQRLKRRLFIFGQTITEVWLDAGTSDFPFRRDNNLLFEHGLEANGSLVEAFELMFYLSRDENGVGGIMMVSGTVPQKISTRNVDETIQSFSVTSDAHAYVYKNEGDIFYVINFTNAQRTFVYNVNTDKWHEMQMLNGNRHIGQVHVFFNDKHYLGSYLSTSLYDFDTQYLDNAGEAIKRTRICRNFNSPLYTRIRVDRFHIDMLQGVGTPSTPIPILGTDKDPVVYLYVSQDGGLTYDAYGPAQIGQLGERLKRTIWRRLGVKRDWIIKIEIFNKVPIYILGAAIDFMELPE